MLTSTEQLCCVRLEQQVLFAKNTFIIEIFPRLQFSDDLVFKMFNWKSWVSSLLCRAWRLLACVQTPNNSFVSFGNSWSRLQLHKLVALILIVVKQSLLYCIVLFCVFSTRRFEPQRNTTMYLLVAFFRKLFVCIRQSFAAKIGLKRHPKPFSIQRKPHFGNKSTKAYNQLKTCLKSNFYIYITLGIYIA